MKNIESYKLIKKQTESLINNRHLYVASIIKELFNPLQHKNLCEIGAGNFELATILAASYESIDAYEMYPERSSKNKISNLKIYSSFSRYTNVSNYQLLISVCPYYYAYDIFDDIDTEEVTKNLITDILDMSIDKNINSFIILSDTSSSDAVMKEVQTRNKYTKIGHDDIRLFYEKDDKMNISNNKVLIYKR
jgi:hypothetical protein